MLPDDSDFGPARTGARDGGPWRRLLAGALAVGLLLAPAFAAQDDPRLDGLFTRLKAAHDEAEVERLTGAIWSIWHQSGRGVVDAQMQEGEWYMRLGSLGSALDDFSAAVAWAPDFAEAWHKRATVHFLMGNYPESIADLHRTLDLEPRHFGALGGLALIYLKLNEERAALAAMEKALEINPHLPRTRRKVQELHDRLDGKKL
ncbi:MAG: tetratricopeptide repeat protein [Rhodospirillales bacterium]